MDGAAQVSFIGKVGDDEHGAQVRQRTSTFSAGGPTAFLSAFTAFACGSTASVVPNMMRAAGRARRTTRTVASTRHVRPRTFSQLFLSEAIRCSILTVRWFAQRAVANADLYTATGVPTGVAPIIVDRCVGGGICVGWGEAERAKRACPRRVLLRAATDFAAAAAALLLTAGGHARCSAGENVIIIVAGANNELTVDGAPLQPPGHPKSICQPGCFV